MLYCKGIMVSIITSSSLTKVMSYIIGVLVIIIMFSKSLYVNSKIIRVDHHYFAPFTLIDTNKRLMQIESSVQTLTNKATVYECLSACVLNKNCTTFNYHREKKVCELLNMSKFDAFGVLHYQLGWLHYETDDNVRLMGQACSQLNPCKAHEVCEDTFTPTLYTCKCQDHFNGSDCRSYIGPGSNQSFPAPTCSLLMKRYENIPDGEYWIQNKDSEGGSLRKNCTRYIKYGKERNIPTPTAKSPTVTTLTTMGKIKTAGSILKFFSNESAIVKGRLITTIPRLSKYFRVSFEVYPTSYSDQWGSILHMTIGGNYNQYGDRTPAIWFIPATSSATMNKIAIYSAVNGNINHNIRSNDYPLNAWIKVKVEQTEVNRNAVYSIYLDDTKVHGIVNNQPSDFDSVKVYAGDPWHPAQNGMIRNLIIENQI